MYKLSVKQGNKWVDYAKSPSLPELEKKKFKLEMEGNQASVSKC